MLRLLKNVLNPMSWLHTLRLVHFYAYSNVRQIGLITRGTGVSMAPNVSFRNGQRISIGSGSHIGERCLIWAGDSTGRITIGDQALFGPGVMVTASNYAVPAGRAVMDQQKLERDVVIGARTWLGAYVVVTAGVRIGDGAVVGAGAVVTRDLPDNCIAGGVPAKVIGWRPGAGPTS